YCSVVVWRNAKGISEAFIKNVSIKINMRRPCDKQQLALRL
uniref:Uncharacterized protein n=1 Tax=Parascaris univalens TaxID=6257 RepID=A0A914ZNB9_PARUN